MTPQELVTRIYNVQEGVILDDLNPFDDKYREVIYQVNLVLDEFSRQEDWSQLRRAIVLGPTLFHNRTVPRFELPDYVDRVSMNFGDAIRLCKYRGYHCNPHNDHHHYDFVEDHFIEVPYTSSGRTPDRGFMDFAAPLEARVYGRYVEFTRRPIGPEQNRVAVCDCQIKIPHLHICNEKCRTKDGELAYIDDEGFIREEPLQCKDVEHHILDDWYEDYIIWKTAYNTSKYSPIAGGIRGELNDTAQKLLSKIRQIDANKTRPDIVRRKCNNRVRQVF